MTRAPSRWKATVPRLDPFRDQDACGVGFVAHPTTSSHRVVRLALGGLARVAHRGATSTDRSGDGAGVLTCIPSRFFRRAAKLPTEPFATGMFFLPRERAPLHRALDLLEEIFRQEGLPLLGWRRVPIRPEMLGASARASRPAIRQAFLGAPDGMDEEAWERVLYVVSRVAERRAKEEALSPFFVCSLSCRTVVYKGLLVGTDLKAFYPDLEQPDYESPLALFHQRFSTNTLPSWALAQPFHLLAHNGEINTLWGNRNAMRAREPELRSPVWGGTLERAKPIISDDGSDSTSLDNALELLVCSGHDPVHALMMLMPEALARDADPALRAFTEYHEGLLEPWDGPAALAFSDGVLAGARVDRNGLRPCRYKIAKDGLVVAASEAGIVDLDPGDVVESGRLGPGELIAVDTRGGELLRNAEAKVRVARRRPYAKWMDENARTLKPEPMTLAAGPDAGLVPAEVARGWGVEDVRYVLTEGAKGQEAIWSMGDDAPIPPLSKTAPTLASYFRQRFAQVTNPPIDPLRETSVMSLRMHLGRRGSLLVEDEAAARLLRLEHPILLETEMEGLKRDEKLAPSVLDALWDAESGGAGLVRALDALGARAEKLARGETELVVLSDRLADATRAPLPILLALGAVHQHLVGAGLRTRVSLAVEAGDAWDVHHMAVLFGYGAEAVHPWLALAAVRALETAGTDAGDAFRAASEKGLLKVLSKMGISTLSSYAGGQAFEALGLGAEVIERCFTGTVSLLGGIGFEEIAEDVAHRQRKAFEEGSALPDHGRVRYRRDAEEHGWSPPIVKALHAASKSGGAYAGFRGQTDARAAASPRDLLDFVRQTPIPLEEVEPASALVKRFVSTAMSLGALSKEAHETLAIGMNRMGARSNSGEGGENPETYLPLANGDRADNKIKQVASGRFGVTTEYLVRADELEIKIAQGSKPGEGGQLPGHKNTPFIARLRHAVPGIPLISPPPHHDIYSIEDLAQLIHDLKEVNPTARVGVKLVAEAGVGRIAAGVAKAYADYVLISGHNGGTGASPLSSIKHAGSPWEIGLAETHTVLVENGLRERIEVRVDGGLKTGRDVVVAALLGAESFGFGTAVLVAIGCAMARQCHLNTCPTGIATQREDLRRKFNGTPEQVVAYFTEVAEDVRSILASLGARSLDEIVGRSDLLVRVERPETPRARTLDLSLLVGHEAHAARRTAARNDRPRTGPQFPSLDSEILPEVLQSLGSGSRYSGSFEIRNHNLSVGTRIAGAVARRAGAAGLPPDSVTLRFRGPAGQSFGAFAMPGMTLTLEGEANDYVGKGLSGGTLVLKPYPQAGYASRASEQAIAGNTVLYGATSGRFFAAGRAGDRFAVRNSGAVAVVEGVGAHGCEYMTGGVVAVLGSVGSNFAAGMSDGVAFVLDLEDALASRLNSDMAVASPLDDDDATLLESLLHEHRDRTGSARAAGLLARWAEVRGAFRKVASRAVAAGVRSPSVHENTEGPDRRSERTRGPALPSPAPRVGSL